MLTKRADRLAGLALPWYPNIWAGVTVEDQAHLYRLDYLRQVPASVRFVSYEPLLSPIPGINLDGINWGIVGGETGPGYRPMALDWARDIRDQHRQAGIDFFYNNGGGIRDNVNILDGRRREEFPEPQLGQLAA